MIILFVGFFCFGERLENLNLPLHAAGGLSIDVFGIEHSDKA